VRLFRKSALVGRLQGVDVVMVASFLNKPLYRLVVRPEIRTVADLKGKRSASRASARLPIR
jgi:ABC-type nitrate/sulfonate/bicarbonate transport system substrate-binding protein